MLPLPLMTLVDEVVPASTKSCSGFEVLKAVVLLPIATFPSLVNLATSALFILTIKFVASVVPIKFVPAVVPELPVVNQAFAVEAKVATRSFLTSPLVMVSKLSAVVLVPVTPLNVDGLAPKTCNLVDGVVVPIPTFPALVTLALSTLLVLTTKSTASVFPIKFVPAVSPALPDNPPCLCRN